MGFSPYGSFMFSVIPLIVMVGFVFVIGMIIARAIQGASQWKRNNDSPVLTVDASVVAKRADVSHYHHNTGQNNMSHMSSSTTYFVTFEFPSGDRQEFKVADSEYGMLVEGDKGKLNFQGTRYLGFNRDRA